jgi:hypothetical protein
LHSSSTLPLDLAGKVSAFSKVETSGFPMTFDLTHQHREVKNTTVLVQQEKLEVGVQKAIEKES